MGIMMKNSILTMTAAIALTICAAGCSTTASTTTGASSGGGFAGNGPLSADTKREIDTGYRTSMDRLFATTSGSRELVAKARGVLVFPSVIGAGLGVGGQYGKGELKVNGVNDGYYNTASGSIGLQIGAESKALVFLFMTQDALDRFRASDGWAGGVDASVAVLKVGANGDIDANAARAPTLAFVMTNTGLMANLSLEGTKVTRIQ
jgi:lipid-binding SYLF domain-containing protein